MSEFYFWGVSSLFDFEVPSNNTIGWRGMSVCVFLASHRSVRGQSTALYLPSFSFCDLTFLIGLWRILLIRLSHFCIALMFTRRSVSMPSNSSLVFCMFWVLSRTAMVHPLPSGRMVRVWSSLGFWGMFRFEFWGDVPLWIASDLVFFWSSGLSALQFHGSLWQILMVLNSVSTAAKNSNRLVSSVL